MKIQAAILWRAYQCLIGASSSKGQGRHFIKSNLRALEDPVNKILDKIEAYHEEWEFAFARQGVAFSLSIKDATKEGVQAFEKYLIETYLEVNPYLMTKDVLQDIDDISMSDEIFLQPFFLEHADEFVKAQRKREEAAATEAEEVAEAEEEPAEA